MNRFDHLKNEIIIGRTNVELSNGNTPTDQWIMWYDEKDGRRLNQLIKNYLSNDEIIRIMSVDEYDSGFNVNWF